MKYIILVPAVCGIVALCADQKVNKITYPNAKKSDVVDNYFGANIPDPYRWLEDTNSAETTAWVEEENKVTQAYMAQIPERDRIRKRLTELFNYERYTNAFEVAGKYFLFRNDGLQNQDVLYVLDTLDGSERVLLDPNTIRADGTAALSGLSVNRQGKLAAYAIAQAGSDWSEWHVRDVTTGRDLEDSVQWTKFTNAEWTAEGTGFYYQRFPQPDDKAALTASNQNAQLYFHRLGQPQKSDQLVYERPDQPRWLYTPMVSDDGRFLVIEVFTGDESKNLVFYQDLKALNRQTVELVSQLTAQYNFLENRGNIFYFKTTDGAPRGRIIAIDITQPDRDHWREIIPEQKEALSSAQVFGHRLILSYLRDARSRERVAELDGEIVRDVPIPGVGSVVWSPAHQDSKELIYSYTSFTAPTAFYRYDPGSNKSTLLRQSKLSFDPSDLQTEQVFYTSKDGTKVPMFLVHRQGLKRDGQNPTILYGYGGFNIAITPSFNPIYVQWMEMGGIFAVANIRGGSEYGEAWHQAGTKLHKQNVFDDFIAAAEFLVANDYTSSAKLAIHGGSNGGLLIGAVLNQRPDLFGAAMPAVGVMDMLRYNKFTIGAAWEGDYGSPENQEEFRALRAYSPLHNIKPGRYPATLITTSDHDDRVVPGHSFKYAATLQIAQRGAAPILIRIETRAGHGAGKPTTKKIDEAADRFAFLVRELHLKL